MLPPFTRNQLAIMLLALDHYQADIATDLHGWTIGGCKTEIDCLASTMTVSVEVEELRIMIDKEISNDLPSH